MDFAARLKPHLSRERAKTVFQELVRVPSPQTDLLEEEPALRAFMEDALIPRMPALNMGNVHLDAMGNLIAETGAGTSGRSLMLVTHAMNQPPSTMPDPYGGKVIDATPHGLPGEAVLGKGASEQKGTMAAMLHAIEAVQDAKIALDGKLYFICCVSGETGKHDAIRNVVEREGVRADIAFVYGNSLKLQLGNRGRVDMKAIVHGTPGHSSRPNDAANAITGAMEFLKRLKAEIPNDRKHAQLGTAWLTCNRIESFPKSTHTIQDRCEISLDRRLLPGDDPDAAVAEVERVAKAMAGWPDPISGKPLRVTVEKGPVMYASLVTEDAPVV
ncbi:MAG TPA: peptidase dimerization domain-containing protein, partial [Burkholderiales bacterium]|nr:peptidase dimerization domain-containing protein [Burkholderiales bacterium]